MQAAMALCVSELISAGMCLWSQKLERTWQMCVRVRLVRFVLKSGEAEVRQS